MLSFLKLKFRAYLLVLTLFLGLTCPSALLATEVDGSRILSDGSMDLSGPFDFYWKHFLSEKVEERKKVPTKTIKALGNGWNFIHPDVTTYGYGSYNTTLNITKDAVGRKLTFLIDWTLAYRIYINGKEIGRLGVVSKEPVDFFIRVKCTSF